MKQRIKYLFLVMGVLLVLAGCQAPAASKEQSNKIQVVASLDFYAEPVRAILGTHGAVTSLINSPSVDPHDYTPTTNDAKKVSQAQVVLMNGAGYDSWLKKLVAADNNEQQLLDVATDIVHLPDGANEHLWYNFKVMPQVTKRLVKIFSKIQPQHQAEFTKNGQAYLKKLTKLQQQEKTLRARLQGQRVLVTEPVFNYVLGDVGMKVANAEFAQDIEEGADPKPADLHKMQQQLDRREVAALVYNEQVSSSLVTSLVARAKKNKVPVIGVTETLPRDKTYLTWMSGSLTKLAELPATAAE